MKIATIEIPVTGVLIGMLFVGAVQSLGETKLPLEIRQDKTLNNYQSERGVPLSMDSDDYGSDGRAPNRASEEQIALTRDPPTSGQFASLLSWGAVAYPENPGTVAAPTITSGSYAGNAANIELPHGTKDGDLVVVMQRAQVGAPYLNRPVSFLFGAIIPPPDEDENGTTLPDSVLPNTYWVGQPHLPDDVKATGAGEKGDEVSVTVEATSQAYETGHKFHFTGGGELTLTAEVAADATTLTGDLTKAIVSGEIGKAKHTDKGYYYSPHSRAVYAIQPGPIEIVWQKSERHNAGPVLTVTTDVSNVVSAQEEVAQGMNVTVTVAALSRDYISGEELTFSGGGVLTLTTNVVSGDTTLTGDLAIADIADADTAPTTVSVPITVDTPNLKTSTTYSNQHEITFSGGIVLTLTEDAPPSAQVLTGNITAPLSSGSTSSSGAEHVLTDGDDTSKWVQSVGNYYKLYSKGYVVSGSASKPPRKIYWNQAGYQGPEVTIEEATIGEIVVVYNSSFPETVNPGVKAVDTAVSGGAGGSNNDVAHFNYTLVHDSSGVLMALNAEGRVFMELLGDPREDGRTRFHLGYEIVDVFKHSTPASVTIELGDQVQPTAAPVSAKNALLEPKPIMNASTAGEGFTFQTGGYGTTKTRYYAAKETKNLNDYQIHWMEEGLEGILWPSLHVRYKFIWPEDPARYSHYVRPTIDSTLTDAASFAAARETAVQLSIENAPWIQYQDLLDVERGKLTAEFKFYTWLNEDYPQHRSLIRYSSGGEVFFERVFSWLDTSVKDGSSLGQSDRGVKFWVPARDLKIWGTSDNPSAEWKYDAAPADGSAAVTTLKVGFLDNNQLNAPRYIAETVNVGDRILAPTGELGASDSDYWAGYILDKFNLGPYNKVGAYIDPIAVGFDKANKGAIIPVNANPGNNTIEVYWYRKNAAETAKGFEPTYWPSVLGTYTVQWPTSPKEIVLASNDGSGPLGSLEGKGEIYRQNDPMLAGYNPNEEHALILSGQAYALRDDLNNQPTGTVTSDAYVLIQYTEADGRPAMSVYRVLREKESAGILFDYITEAGQMLQSPMPLPLLPKPIQPKVLYTDLVAASEAGKSVGDVKVAYRNYNQEPPASGGDNPVGWYSATDSAGDYQDWVQFTYRDRKGSHWVYRGLHAGPPTLEAGTYTVDAVTAQAVSRSFVNVTAAATLTLDTNKVGPYSLTVSALHRDYKAGQVLEFNHPTVFTLTADAMAGATTLMGNLKGGDIASAEIATTPGPVSVTVSALLRQYQSDEVLTFSGGGVLTLTAVAAAGDTILLGILDKEDIANPQTAGSFGDPVAATAVSGEDFSYTVHASRRAETLNMTVEDLPDWLSIDSLTLKGRPTTIPETSELLTVVLTPTDGSGAAITKTLTIDYIATGTPLGQAPMDHFYTDSAGATRKLGDRAPYLATNPKSSDSFTMRFYYKTREGFDWPDPAQPNGSITTAPAVGEIVPYLLPLNGSGVPVGVATSKDTLALGIVYRPVWPANPPKLQLSQTLTMPFEGLPQIRGQKSINVLYQQSIAQNIRDPEGGESVILHDPTREKTSNKLTVFYTESEAANKEGKDAGDIRLPAAKTLEEVQTSTYLGKTYFQKLEPHLAERFYYDPNRGVDGELVFKGEYMDEMVGEKYLRLNVMSAEELVTIKALCPPSSPDVHKTTWDAAIDDLATQVQTFYQDDNAKWQANENKASDADAGVVQDKFGDSINIPVEYTAREVSKIYHADMAVDSYALSATGPGNGYVTLIENNGRNPDDDGLPVSLHVIRVVPTMYTGELKVILASNPLDEKVTFQHTADLAAKFDEFEYEWMIQGPTASGDPPALPTSGVWPQDVGSWSKLPDDDADDNRYVLGGSSGIQTLTDNYVIMRYRPITASHPKYGDTDGDSTLSDQEKEAAWSPWTTQVLAEGWIKRVLAAINPFSQRVIDLMSNSISTDASMLTQAGKRWEGDIALNLDNINDSGLLEIYETVLNRGKMLSIDAGINYGPANDTLLLAAGYINDLYMILGNEAWADAANPTIGIGSKDATYGDIATAMFAFKGQVASLLEEELALLRGRDDFMQPGVETSPVYNKMFWNYTRGIDAGEVIYALNYNITEDQDADSLDGSIDAEDAARLFPQGHGDAYGHYLTALKGYYKLITDADFTWAPRSEAVNVLGKAVQVDYMDERKFAAAASALAEAGNLVFELTWRRDYEDDDSKGWAHLAKTRTNDRRTHTEGTTTVESKRHWSLDHWAARTGIGSLVNWVVGNAMLPAEDNDPSHEGIQKIDRTTVPELHELVAVARELQINVDNATGYLTPIGLPENALVFDVNPNSMSGGSIETHYEQIADRANKALANAVSAFDDAKDVTQMMRWEADSLVDLQATVDQQELAFTHELIELYGTPYPSDMGPGKLYPTDYAGPDLWNYAYHDNPAHKFPETYGYTEKDTQVFRIRDIPTGWNTAVVNKMSEIDWNLSWDDPDNEEFWEDAGPDFPLQTHTAGLTEFTVQIDKHGMPDKPEEYTGKRASPGQLQQAVSDVMLAHVRVKQELKDASGAATDFKHALDMHKAQLMSWKHERAKEYQYLEFEKFTDQGQVASQIIGYTLDSYGQLISDIIDCTADGLPKSLVFGFTTGGDMLAPGRFIKRINSVMAKNLINISSIANNAAAQITKLTRDYHVIEGRHNNIEPQGIEREVREAFYGLIRQIDEMHDQLWAVNAGLRKYENARAHYRALVAKGDRLTVEREIFRKRAAAMVHGFRTRDAAFRIFRNEKLERYKSLYDIAAKYTYLAANAYDYETGLLQSEQGKSFVERIINARALGVVADGTPQYAASNTGDPGLSSILAEMQADWDVLKGRLGFNNPDTYGTTVSLRTENYRIVEGADGETDWRDVLNTAEKDDIRQDADVSRYCLQIDNGDDLPAPGLILEFSTTISEGRNLFGKPLAAGDHYFSPSSFATKIHAIGIAFEGYQGISDPNSNSAGVNGAGGTSPSSPGSGFLDSDGLSATPYVYLIPVGQDSMRSPPLGDASTIRTWTVMDVAVPMPFNIGQSGFNNMKLWQTRDSLTEELFAIRKHQAFRASSSTGVFKDNPRMFPDNYTNTRLIGRSAWNSKWKLVIPGRSLLNDADEGLDRFMEKVTDIKIHLNTYSYSGN